MCAACKLHTHALGAREQPLVINKYTGFPCSCNKFAQAQTILDGGFDFTALDLLKSCFNRCHRY